MFDLLDELSTRAASTRRGCGPARPIRDVLVAVAAEAGVVGDELPVYPWRAVGSLAGPVDTHGRLRSVENAGPLLGAGAIDRDALTTLEVQQEVEVLPYREFARPVHQRLG